ncbi:uncharacterized protein LOC119557321 [Drosophila subpulchrella]|uniref:uncharacterized protein LOC119557321 n=1 Tax=Drosophila subpulchrella TaxID=1486046 RepID=UPI0018A17323|nr:uncharacterized protein LOC119557321 [Drosophila subpulchrella]
MEKLTLMEPNAGEQVDYMLDEKLDLLAELGDCHKSNLGDIDVIARTTNKCQSLNARMISLVSQGTALEQPTTVAAEETESQEEETEQVPYGLVEEEVTSDEESKTLRAIHGLDQILKRIDILQSQIRRHQQLEHSTEQSEDQISCSGLNVKHSEIRCIQRAQHHIQCQITELLCRYDGLREMLRTLSQTWACLERRIADIRSHNVVHLEWTQESANDLSNCQQRHRSLAAVKLTKKMALLVTKTNMSSGFRYNRRFLRRALLSRHINDFRYEIAELKLLSEQICAEIDKRLNRIKTRALKMGIQIGNTPRESKTVAEVAEVFAVARNPNPKVMGK